MSIVARKVKMMLFFGFWLGLFFLIWKNMLVLEQDGLFAGWVNVWGDWAAHLSYATSFGYGKNVPLEMPILAGAKFSYPFLSDWVSGILMSLGINLISSMLVPGFVLSMAMVAALFWLGEKVSGSFRGGIVTSLLFLFNGGLGFWWFLKDVVNLGFVKTVQALPREYTHLSELANIEWINIISSQVIPQRGFLMGFPLAIVVYWLLWQKFEIKKDGLKKMVMAGFLGCLLPLIHAHSFVMVAWVGFWLMLMEVWRLKREGSELNIGKFGNIVQLIKVWSGFWLPIFLLGVPQVLHFYGGSLGSKGFIRFQPGWMAEGSVLWFWFKNLGFSLVLALWGMRLAGKKLLKFSLPFWGLFLVGNLWIFQPWEWDNTKIFTHWYLLTCVLGAVAVTKLSKDGGVKKVVIGLILLVSVWSGFLDTLRLSQYKKIRLKFFDNNELVLAEWVKNSTERSSRFLTADNHDHWVPVLTGRKIVLGFKGWLWTYGLDYSSQEKAVNRMFKGGVDAKEYLEEYGVDYVVVGRLEREREINEEFYEDNFKMVYELGETKIFQVTNL